ncbi:toll/interleukin-1 receptor domain-containing protein [Actinomyces sp. MRS3W]|uniref:toll/interleukin-1 receptor domain-containing protein n=1 Tax=Actinomyces sp. MRS3W TaxID=2800796 RepID=UPI0028FD4BCE|nr:toll/interleukin-1 receptor domain-containing protein [Actinomyces sp. MRS3W]MDU0348169.1 toll/interleukin-1 receptor domain-containing protein [Actinomyces sp. MRS3W]
MTEMKVFLSYNEDPEGTAAATELHGALSTMHVDAVMAQHSIRPGADWEQTIRTQLEASAALISVGTKGYSTRPWCQQEVGWALGRHVPILWIQYAETEVPAGFLARNQALLPEHPEQADSIAEQVLQWLAGQKNTRDQLVAGLLSALKHSNSFKETRQCAAALALAGTLSESEWSRVVDAAESNRQVRDAVEWQEQGSRRWRVSVLNWLKKRVGPPNS